MARRQAATPNAGLDELLGDREAPANLGNFPPATQAIEEERAARDRERRTTARETLDDDQGLDALDDDDTLDGADAAHEARGGETTDDEDQSDEDTDRPRSTGSPRRQRVRGGLSADLDERLAAQDAQLAAQQRELEFLRAQALAGPSHQVVVGAAGGAAAQGQADPFNIALPFEISEQDIETLQAGGENARLLLQRALTLTARQASMHTAAVVANAYLQNEQTKTTGESAVAQFYTQNPELQQFREIVQAKATELWPTMPYASLEQKLTVLGERTRARLREMGIRTDRKTRRRAASTAAIEPAERPRRQSAATSFDMGGSGRRNGHTRLSSREKTMLELVPPGML